MILKALVETNDREICEGIIGTAKGSASPSSFVADRVELLLRTYKAYNLKTRSQTLAFLGEKFAPVLQTPITMTHEKVGLEFLRRIVLPHLGNVKVTEAQNNDKFQLLLFMVRKLYALAAGDCALDNPDAVSNQEVLLGGFLYGMILKETVHEWLLSIGGAVKGLVSVEKWRQICRSNISIRIPAESCCKDKRELGWTVRIFPFNWKSSESHRVRLAASLRLHYHCREDQFLQIHQSFSMHTSRCFLCPTEDDYREKVASRELGFSVSNPYS